jgi:methionyl-tRNA formyltransferase
LQHARTHNIDIYTDSAPSAVDSLVRAAAAPIAVVVSSYDRILPAELLQVTSLRQRSLCAAAALSRAGACVNWAIINGEPFDRDHGSTRWLPNWMRATCCSSARRPSDRRDTVGDLYERLNEIQRSHLARSLLGTWRGNPRDPLNRMPTATYGCTRLPEDGEIDWTASTRTTDRLIRALTDPYPGALHASGRPKTRDLQSAPGWPIPRTSADAFPGESSAVSAGDGHVDVLHRGRRAEAPRGQSRRQKDRCPAAQAISSVRTTLGLKMGHFDEPDRRLEEQIEQLQRSKTS